MSQTSLLSFFQRKPNARAKAEEKATAECSNEDSPVKATSRKKRQRISSSSSEGSNKSGDEAAVEKSKRISTPNKKSYISKLAKFSASPRKEKREVKDNVENNSKIEKGDDEKSSIKKKCDGETEKSECIVEEDTIGKASDKEPEDSKPIKASPSSDTKKQTKEKAVKNFFAPKTNGKSSEGTDSKTGKECSSYDPSVTKYHPIESACWKKDEKVPYYALARTLEEIEKESARLKMIALLSNYLRSVLVLSPDDFLASVYLCLNKLGPAHFGLELGLAEQTLIRAMSQSTGRTVTQIRNEVSEVGDIGLVAERSRSSQRLMFQPAALTVSSIFNKFKEIAAMTGQAAVNKKISIIQNLYVACKGPEARFMIRSLNGKLRIGLAEQSVLQAMALAVGTTPPGQDYPPEQLNLSKTMSADSFKAHIEELALILKTTYCECPNYDAIVPVMLREGIKALPEHCKITPGLPLKPMLAQPTKGVQEVLTRFEGIEFTCEWKYDGERAQIHCSEDGVIRIYSRNQEDNTSKYPDIIERISTTKKDSVKSFILDCEAVAWDTEEKQILPFQVLSKRKRKDADKAEIKIAVCVFMFDLLYLNGEPLVKRKFFDRRQLLHENFTQVDGEWQFATSIDTSKMEEVQDFLEVSIKGNCEGLMVKTLKEEATYEIAKRSRNWLKLKKDYLEGVGDTLDLVVMGGYLGKGKRTGAYGGFLIACYDEDSEEYQSVCKIGTGFSDEALATHATFFKDHIIEKAPAYYRFDASLEPDHWFEPVQVWETKCADLSLSPIHRAAIGMIDPEKGISMRFPRFLRIRDDKKPEGATTAQQIVDLYQSQEQVKNQQKGTSKFNEEDFY